MANGNVYSWGKGRNINFDHHRGAAFQNLSSRIHVGLPNRLWVSSGTRSEHYTAAHETYWNIRPRAVIRRLQTWPAQNIIGRIGRSENAGSDQLDRWLEHVDKLEPEDLHLAQWSRRMGRSMPPRPRFPKALPEGSVTNTSVGEGVPPGDLAPK